MGEITELLVRILASLQVLKISNLLSQFSILQFSEKMANTAISKLKQDLVVVRGKIDKVGNLNNNRVFNTTSTARYNPHADQFTGKSKTSIDNNYFISELTAGGVTFVNLNIFDRRIWETMHVGDEISLAVYSDFQTSGSGADSTSFWVDLMEQVSAGFNIFGSIDSDVLIYYKTNSDEMTYKLRTGAWTERFYGKLITACLAAWLKVFAVLMVTLVVLKSFIGNIEILSPINDNLFVVFFALSLIPVFNIMFKGTEYIDRMKRDLFAFINSSE